MTKDQLMEVMKYHLRNFSSDGDKITDETIHSTVLTDDDGFGSASSKRIYRSFIRWTLKQAGHEDKKWPKNWMELSVSELTEKLLND